MIPIRTLQRRNGSVSESSCSMLDWVDDDGYLQCSSSESAPTRHAQNTNRCSLAPFAFRGQTGHDALRNMCTYMCADGAP